MRALPTIGSFWFGSDLTWLEQLCIQSFLDRGHRFVLYTDGTVGGAPTGVELADVQDILWPAPFDISDGDRHRVAVFADIFRLHMVQKTGFVWADLDAYCLRPFDFGGDYIFSVSEVGLYPNGVIGLPTGSVALSRMISFLSSDNPIQPWKDAKFKTNKTRRIAKGERWGIEDLSWGNSGPKTFGHFLKETGEVAHALPTEALYPLAPPELGKLHLPDQKDAIERDGVYSVHFYGHQKKHMARHMNGLPKHGSYLAHLCERHGINPMEAPIPILPWMRNLKS